MTAAPSGLALTRAAAGRRGAALFGTVLAHVVAAAGGRSGVLTLTSGALRCDVASTGAPAAGDLTVVPLVADGRRVAEVRVGEATGAADPRVAGVAAVAAAFVAGEARALAALEPLRDPILAITGFADLLAEDGQSLGADQRRWFEHLRTEAARLTSTLRALEGERPPVG